MPDQPIRSIPFGRPWITEAEQQAALAVLNQPILAHGREGQAFAESFAAFMGPGAHAVATSSCMAALHLASLHFGFGPGDEVVVPAMTHVATAHAIEITGARPVFVDATRATGNIDPAGIRAVLTPRTRAISLVHFLGIPAPMAEILEIARAHDLKVIEDCATGVGSRLNGTHVGLLGDAGCFSFYPTKHITTAEGGMFVSRHESVVKRVERLRAFHLDRSHTERAMPGIYDVTGVGLNYRMSEIAAAIGRVQLARIDDIMARRRANFAALRQRIAPLPDVRVIDVVDPAAEYVPFCFSAVLEGRRAAQRDDVVRRLQASGIGTSVHYPHPVPRLAYYREKYGYDPARFANAAAISDCSINLPVGPHIDADAADYMAETFIRALGDLPR